MAERNFDTKEVLGRKVREISGAFKPNGAGAIDNTLNKGQGFTAAYTTTGTYTVTLTDKYGKVRSCLAKLVQATRTQTVEVKSAVATTGLIVIEGFAVGSTVVADITAATETYIHFTVTLEDQANL